MKRAWQPPHDAQPGDVFRAGRRVWSSVEDEDLRHRYPDVSTVDLAVELRRSVPSVYARAKLLGLSKSAAYLASPLACRLRRGDDVGAAYRFQKGIVPHNKGQRRPGWAVGRMAETQFKPGVPSWRLMPIGSTRLIDGYVYRKVSDVPRVPYSVNWKPEHHLVWTSAHGHIPKGHAIAFKNGDKADVRLENLALISRRDLMRRNSVHQLPKPLASAIQLLGALKRQIRRKHGQEQDQRPA